MNTGERLVSLSGLSSGSALARLLAIQTGTGTGDSFYSGAIRVVTSRNEISVSRKAKQSSVEQDKPVPQYRAPNKNAARVSTAFVVVPQKEIYSFTSPEEVFVLVQNYQTTVAQTAPDAVVAQRNKP